MQFIVMVILSVIHSLKEEGFMNRHTILTTVLCLIMVVISGCSALDYRGKKTENNSGLENPPAVSTKNDIRAFDSKSDEKTRTKTVVTLHAVGRGIAPEDAISRGQAIILGESAARSNGYVKLAEKIYGVYVDSYRLVGRGKVDFEMVHQETQALLKGAEVLEYRQLEHGIFEVYMEVKVVVSQGHPLYPSGS
jgi:hypothetical protein